MGRLRRLIDRYIDSRVEVVGYMYKEYNWVNKED